MSEPTTTLPTKVYRQVLASAEARGRPTWIPAERWFPGSPRCVLATDGEGHFIACHEEDKWINAHTEEEIDSHITHWMECPELPAI